jgi:transcriptional regulator with XRE-family HTH domain
MLSDISHFLNNFDPNSLVKDIVSRAKQLRLSQNITQTDLAVRSGVSLGSLKRFERTGEISIHNLLKLAVALNATDAFRQLFALSTFASVDEVLKIKKAKTRKRASKKL